MLFHKESFLEFVIEQKMLKFGDFVTKSGRATKYFFNTGSIITGKNLLQFAKFYAQFIIDKKIDHKIIFGPAYKGISLSIATSIALAEMGYESNFSYNRKENKDHGEGGNIIGASLRNNVLIIDDVITSGLSIIESIQIIRNYSAVPQAAIVALDRQEDSIEEKIPTKNFLEKKFNIPIYSLLNLDDLKKNYNI